MKLHEAIEGMGPLSAIRPVGHKGYGYVLQHSHLTKINSQSVVKSWQYPRFQDGMTTNAGFLSGEWEYISIEAIDLEDPT